jgi:hypothetical protein
MPTNPPEAARREAAALKRYNVRVVYVHHAMSGSGGDAEPCAVEASDGEWVFYADAKAQLEARDQEKATAVEDLSLLAKDYGIEADRADALEAQLVTQAQENERLLLEIKRCDEAYDERTALLDEWRLMATKANSRLASLQAQIREIRDEVRASAGSDPSFETNRTLKKQWADRLSLLVEEQIPQTVSEAKA